MKLIRKTSHFSNFGGKMVDKLVEKLNKEKVVDYEVVTNRIPNDVISVAPGSRPMIYIPMSLEYSQYDIDDYLRQVIPYIRTNTTLDRNIFVMKLSGSLNVDQLNKLVKYIISIEDFCSIVSE